MTPSKNLSPLRVDLDSVPSESRGEVENWLLERLGGSLFAGELESVYSLEFAGGTEVCPRCGGALEGRPARFIYGTNESACTSLAPAGYFCKACPSAVVDVEMVRKSAKPGLVFGGILGLQGPGNDPILFKTWNEGQIILILNDDGTPNGILTYDEASLRTDSGDGLPKPRLSIMPDPVRQVFRLPAGRFEGTEYQLRFSVCNNPFRSCRHVEFFPRAAKEGGTGGKVPYFRVDIGKRELCGRELFERFHPDSVPLGEAFLSALTEEDWRQIGGFFQRAKIRQEVQCSPEDSRITFSREYLEDDCLMVPYLSVFPFAKSGPIEDEGSFFELVDAYFVHEGVGHSVACLQWFNSTEAGTEKEPEKPKCLFYYDFLRERVERDAKGPLREKARRFLGLLKKFQPGVTGELARRRKLLSALVTSQ